MTKPKEAFLFSCPIAANAGSYRQLKEEERLVFQILALWLRGSADAARLILKNGRAITFRLVVTVDLASVRLWLALNRSLRFPLHPALGYLLDG